ncbi:MAG: DUF488 domain-containing protein [Candidatus Firestonebacteria bacterium]|nr:DUF488 domain-containing protein [Candidatus Firestonebacteria bacterium]
MPENKKRPRTVILTLGFSNRTLPEVLEILRKGGIQILADIRAVPTSTMLPGFNREHLAEDLPKLGITYHHLKELSGEGRKAKGRSPNTGIANVWRPYADHMLSEEFERGLIRLQALAMIGPVAVLNIETDWKKCCRRFLADALTQGGMNVQHVDRNGSLLKHELTPRCILQQGKTIYPAQGEQLALF